MAQQDVYKRQPRNTSRVTSARSYAAAARSDPAPSASSSSTSPSALAEVKSFFEEYDLEEVARLYRSIRDRLRTATPTEKFLLLAEAAAAIGLL